MHVVCCRSRPHGVEHDQESSQSAVGPLCYELIAELWENMPEETTPTGIEPNIDPELEKQIQGRAWLCESQGDSASVKHENCLLAPPE